MKLKFQVAIGLNGRFLNGDIITMSIIKRGVIVNRPDEICLPALPEGFELLEHEFDGKKTKIVFQYDDTIVHDAEMGLWYASLKKAVENKKG
jgi:hypothetical protein